MISLGKNNLNHACTVLNSDFAVTNQERDLGVAATSPEDAQCAEVKEAKKLLGITKNGIKNTTPTASLPVGKTLVHPHLGFYVKFCFYTSRTKWSYKRYRKGQPE